MKNNPRILEINTRIWIKNFGQNATLSSIDDKIIDKWKQFGFDAIWFMGVWKNHKESVSEFCFEPELINAYSSALKDWKNSDVIGSPYSIDDYKANPDIGSEEELLNLRERLNKRGIKLILDFIGNHFSARSSLIWSNKEIFLPADEFIFNNDPYTFFHSPANPNEFLAHGRDPLFPPWKDTAQVNYYSRDARDFMIQILHKLTNICDGVRCDMAMLPLNNVFFNTWVGVIRKYGFQRPRKEFWEEAIQSVKSKKNDFVFIAETYWDLEWQLQQMGFDFTYDKRLTDRLSAGDVRSIKDHFHAEQEYQKKSVRFLENHDEDRAMVKFGREKSLAAAIVISTVQGMVFYNDGQFEGKRIKLPLQLGREPEEKPDEKIVNFYNDLLEITKHKVFREGSWKMLEPVPTGEQDFSFENLFAWEWRLKDEIRLIVINYNNLTSRCRLKFNLEIKKNKIVLKDLLNKVSYTRDVTEIKERGLFIELKAYNSHIFAFSLS